MSDTDREGDENSLFTGEMPSHGSNARDSSSPTETSSPVILSEAKDLTADRDRPFASLRVTRGDCSNGQGLFFKIEPCLNLIVPFPAPPPKDSRKDSISR